MAKFFETSEDIASLAQAKFEETSLPQMGIELKIISTTKSKNILKASKASATVQYLTKRDALLVIYEEAFDRLSDLYKTLLVKGVFSVVSYDDEKERILIDNRPYADLFNMRHAKDANGNEYGDNYDNALETASLVISQIEDEERERKEQEKAEKAEKRAAKKAAKNS